MTGEFRFLTKSDSRTKIVLKSHSKTHPSLNSFQNSQDTDRECVLGSEENFRSSARFLFF